MIEVVDIRRTYIIGESPVRAFDGVSLNIGQGEFVAIMGASGSGKSTLMHILGLLDVSDSGQCRLMGKEVGKLNGDEQGDFRADALKSLEMVGLGHRADYRPSQMSGGEQQRAAIARALIRDPMLIFADEPTGNLDAKNSHEILRILTELHRQGKTVIMVMHEPDIAAYAGRVITMQDGKIIEDRKKENAGRRTEVSSEPMKLDGHQPLFKPSRMLGFVKQAFRSIAANKVRALLSVLGILVGVASVIAMMALGTGAQASIEERLKSMGSSLLSLRGGSARIRGSVQGSGTFTRFTRQDVEAIAELSPLVRYALGYVTGTAQMVYLNRNWSSTVEGVGIEYGKMRSTIPTIGRWFTSDEIRSRRKVAIMGTTVASELFGNEDPVGQTIKINRINFRVIGILPPKGFAGHRDQDDAVLVPVTTAMHRLLVRDYLNSIYVEVTSADRLDAAKEAIDALVRKRHKLQSDDEDSFYIRDMTEFQEMLSATTQTMSMLLGSIAAISLVVGGIGIMNIMLVSVTERPREIGLRKAIGVRKGEIMLQFLIESVGLTLSGGLIGIVVGIGVSVMLSTFAGWAVKTSMFSVVLATGFSVLIGLFFGLWPAKKAAGLRPVEALRYE